MTEGKKIRAKLAAGDTTRPQDGSVGAVLQAARLAKGLSIEDIAAAIHVRAIQLRAIEDNNIAALPGMTYAVGFVRSYANVLGLNGVEIVQKFKADHGQSPAQFPLAFPEPVGESRMPDPMMIGIGAFLAILVLTVWTLYASPRDEAGIATEQIPPAPVVTTTAGTTIAADVVTEPVQPIPILIPIPEVAAPLPEQPPLPAPAVAAPAVVEEPAAAPAVEKIPAVAEVPPVIKIKAGKTRIVLRANQASWVQVTDSRQGVIYKKVLRPGEQYDVPDQPGLSLVTANAGGLEIYVDGQPVQPIGKPGEIVRGIILDPAELKVKKIKVRD